MENTQQGPKKPRSLPALLGSAFVFFLVVGGAAPLFLHSIGFRFLPSPAYFAQAWPVALIAGCAALLVIACGVWAKGLMPRRNLRGWLLALGGAGAILFLGILAITVFVPMVRALLSPQIVTISFPVDNDGYMPAFECDDEIVFQGLPPFFNALCNVDESTRSLAAQGGIVMVSGHGTSWGIFPSANRPVSAVIVTGSSTEP